MNSFRQFIFASIAYVFCISIVFLPILWGEKDFITHDNLTFFYPSFLKLFQFWDPNLGMGYPTYTEPQNFTFSWIIHLFPKTIFGFNLIALFSVYSACIFTFFLCYNFTKDQLGSWIGGLVFGLGGSIIGQITMLPVPLSTSILPFVVYSFYNLGKHPTQKIYFFLSALSIYLIYSFGWAPIMAHTILFVVLMYLFLFLEKSKLSVTIFFQFGFAAFLGLLLASPSVLALTEILPFTPRSDKINIHAFNSYRMDIENLPKLVYPYLFGGIDTDPVFGFSFLFPFSSTYNFHGYHRYFGILPFFLILPGIMAIKEKRWKYFLIFSLFFYFLVSFGTYNPIGKVLFHLPILNRLRGPVCYFIEINLIVSILSAYGIFYLRSNRLNKPILLGFLGIFLLILGIPFFFIQSQSYLQEAYRHISFQSIFGNNLITFQIMILTLSFLSLLLFFFKSPTWKYIIPLLLFLDLGINQRYTDWYFVKGKAIEQFHSKVDLRGELTDIYYPLSHEGKYYFSNFQLPYVELKNNLNTIYNFRSTNYYGPLEMESISFMKYLRDKNPQLNTLFGVKYTGGIYQGDYFSGLDRSLFVGNIHKLPNHIFPAKSEIIIELPEEENTQKIQDLTLYASMFYNEDDPKLEQSIDFGVYNKENNLTHNSLFRYPEIWKNENTPCTEIPQDKHFYIKLKSMESCLSIFQAKMDLSTKEYKPKFIFKNQGNSVFKIYAISYRKDQKPIFIYPYPLQSNNSKIYFKDSRLVIYENENYPEAYLTNSVFVSNKNTIQTEFIQFANGLSSKDPMHTAFVESEESIPEEFKTLETNQPEEIKPAKILQKQNEFVQIETNESSPKFLVLNHTYFPSWKAFIDGKDTKIYKTNTIVRGLLVPPGKHTIEFRLIPTKVYWGYLLSILTFLGLSYYTFLRNRNNAT